MIQKGTKVAMHYVLTVEGEKVDSSEGQDPLSYVHGEGQIIGGLEEQLAGMKPGEKKQVEVAPDKAYGEYNPQAVQKVSREAFEEAKDLKVGDVVSGEMQGHQFQAVVREMDDESVTLDLNHPLAGKTLHFEIEIVSVE